MIFRTKRTFVLSWFNFHLLALLQDSTPSRQHPSTLMTSLEKRWIRETELRAIYILVSPNTKPHQQDGGQNSSLWHATVNTSQEIWTFNFVVFFVIMLFGFIGILLNADFCEILITAVLRVQENILWKNIMKLTSNIFAAEYFMAKISSLAELQCFIVKTSKCKKITACRIFMLEGISI